jgi:rubrerythrin
MVSSQWLQSAESGQWSFSNFGLELEGLQPELDWIDLSTNQLFEPAFLGCSQNEKYRISKIAAGKYFKTFLKGEVFAKTVCDQVVEILPDVDLKKIIKIQAADEARHAMAIRWLLTNILEITALEDAENPEPFMKVTYASNFWEVKLIGLLIAETVAECSLREVLPCIQNQKIYQLFSKLKSDEVRHQAIGFSMLTESQDPYFESKLSEIENILCTCLGTMFAVNFEANRRQLLQGPSGRNFLGEMFLMMNQNLALRKIHQELVKIDVLKPLLTSFFQPEVFGTREP